MNPEDREDRAFMHGFALALADLNRLHDCPGYVADVISGAGFNLSDFRRAKLEKYDMDELRKVAKQYPLAEWTRKR